LGRSDKDGPKETFIGQFRAALQFLHCCRSCISQQFDGSIGDQRTEREFAGLQ
jgi:hypothetical protein